MTTAKRHSKELRDNVGQSDILDTQAESPTVDVGAPGTRLASVRARLAVWRYPDLPPMPRTRWVRIATAIVVLLAAAFVVFFVSFAFALHNAYLTHAEDLGIMDQALWTTVHGAPLHQTVCDSISDANCLGNVSRVAIHFEPILFPLSLLYLVAASPKTILLVQALVVASGALPAFWLAARRLRSPLAGVVFAAAYLSFPALQTAVYSDFHAVALAAAFLMFALYFLVSRNDVGLLIACILAMATKEEVPVDVVMIGLFAVALQRRYRIGLTLIGIAVAWLVVAMTVLHLASPLGHSPVDLRYAQFGRGPASAAIYIVTHPLQVVHTYVLGPDRESYVRLLLSPVAYLALLSPWALALAVPALAINMFSNDPSMYSGLYQYNAEIVPVLIFASIESVAWLTWGARRLAVAAEGYIRRGWRTSQMPDIATRSVLLLCLVALATFVTHEQLNRGYLPVAQGFTWPQRTAHARLADDIIATIPADASLSAQSDLVPHLSHRHEAYMYPAGATTAQYILLDVTGNEFPLDTVPRQYFESVESLLRNPAYHVVEARDGYLLFERGHGPTLNPGDPNGLPAAFYSFTSATPGDVPHPTTLHLGPSLDLIGYGISPSGTVYLNHPYVTVTTYWRATGPLPAGYVPQIVVTRPDGSQLVEDAFAATTWRQMSDWRPGDIVKVTSTPFWMTAQAVGTVRVGVRVVPGAGAGSTSTPPAGTSPFPQSITPVATYAVSK